MLPPLAHKGQLMAVGWVPGVSLSVIMEGEEEMELLLALWHLWVCLGIGRVKRAVFLFVNTKVWVMFSFLQLVMKVIWFLICFYFAIFQCSIKKKGRERGTVLAADGPILRLATGQMFALEGNIANVQPGPGTMRLRVWRFCLAMGSDTQLCDMKREWGGEIGQGLRTGPACEAGWFTEAKLQEGMPLAADPPV